MSPHHERGTRRASVSASARRIRRQSIMSQRCRETATSLSLSISCSGKAHQKKARRVRWSHGRIGAIRGFPPMLRPCPGTRSPLACLAPAQAILCSLSFRGCRRHSVGCHVHWDIIWYDLRSGHQCRGRGSAKLGGASTVLVMRRPAVGDIAGQFPVGIISDRLRSSHHHSAASPLIINLLPPVAANDASASPAAAA